MGGLSKAGPFLFFFNSREFFAAGRVKYMKSAGPFEDTPTGLETLSICINCPPFLTGSNGHEFVFLLKGHEDLRQDERVMQLFGLVNTLLANDPTSLRKNLRCSV